MSEADVRFRDKVTAVQFLLSVGVVYQHTKWHDFGNLTLNEVHTLLFYLTETCVPFFFMISGYLYFRTYSPQKAVYKVTSRIRTLMIPYLIWNAVYAIFTICLIKLGFIHNATIGGGLLRILNAEFGPLWFVKYLMIFSLISPVTYYLFRKKYLGACSVFVMLVMNAIFYHFGIMRIPINVNANNIAMINYQYIFFGMGAYGALNFRKVVETPSWKKTFVAGIVWLALIASYGIFSMEKSNALTSHLFRLVYAVALWFALDFVKVFKIQCWMKNSFFLYCSHLMLLQCLQRVCEIIIGKVRLFQATLYVLEYMFLPVVVVIVLMSLAEFMKKRIPKTYKVLTGNRG